MRAMRGADVSGRGARSDIDIERGTVSTAPRRADRARMLAMAATTALAALSWGGPARGQTPPDAPPATSARLVVDASALRSDAGRVRCLLFASREGFPRDARRAAGQSVATPSGGRARCVFERVTPGAYAVALHHDEDGDDVFDTHVFGIPAEGIAASRDARGSFGPPSFEDARFEVTAPSTRIAVRMTYL